MNRTLNCNQNLFKWKIKESPNCNMCNISDTNEHHLFYCTECIAFWKKIQDWLSNTIEVTYKFTVCEILLGLEEGQDPVLQLLNFIIIMGKLFINHSKTYDKPLYFFNFLATLKNKLQSLQVLYKTEGNIDTFEKKYGIIFNNL